MRLKVTNVDWDCQYVRVEAFDDVGRTLGVIRFVRLEDLNVWILWIIFPAGPNEFIIYRRVMLVVPSITWT